jgi:hypothetical protein
LAASLPLATPTTIANGEPAGDTTPPALAPKAMPQLPAPDAASWPRAASAAEAGDALGARLIAERSFHANVSASSPATAQPIGGWSSVVDPPSPAIAVLDAPILRSPHRGPRRRSRPKRAPRRPRPVRRRRRKQTRPARIGRPRPDPARSPSARDAPRASGRASLRQPSPASPPQPPTRRRQRRKRARRPMGPVPTGPPVCRRTAEPTRLNPRLRRR